MNDNPRGSRGSGPFGSGRRTRGTALDGLLERFLSDVVSWFDDERDATSHPRRTGARRPHRDARPGDDLDDFAAAPAGRASAREAGKPSSGTSGASDDVDTAPPSPSMRGRGPKNYRRSDERIGELVNDALLDDERLDATDVEVSVSNGEVVLAGRVASRADKHRAEDLAAYVSGVDDVDNRLRVRRPESKASAHPGGLPGDAEQDADDYGHP